MDSSISHERQKTSQKLAWIERVARIAILGRMQNLKRGSLQIEDSVARQTLGQVQPGELAADISIHDGGFYRDLFLGGMIGAAESFMKGGWSSSNLTELIRLFVRNQDAMMRLDSGVMRLARPMHHIWHRMRKNTRAGSRKNIAAHYDLSNEFFRLFLDETMMYSCAIFEHEDSTLKAASEYKNDHICKKLGLNRHHRLLEIGTGWGGFAIHAAGKYGCHVTTTTISEKQFAEAARRIRGAGLQDRITLLKKDYRDLTGQYDRLVSIEMIEAVGHQFLGEFFRQCASLLKPDGAMLLQAITIKEQDYEAHVKSVDFIKRYIFPGSCLLSLTAMANAATRFTDTRMFHLEDITSHYARTLRIWRGNMLKAKERVKAMGFDDAFLRMWEFYFTYCEAGFAERYIGTVQLILTRPECNLEIVQSRQRRHPAALTKSNKGRCMASVSHDESRPE